jgi:anthranilate synthase component 2
VLHGVTSITEVKDNDEYLFQEVTPKFQATHYHSWSVVPESIPPDILVTATNDDGLIMGLRHKQYDVKGLQFHPESVMTTEGTKMIKNWLKN